MTIAWGSLVLRVLLLTGFIFFLGIYWPEKFTREAEQRSPLGHLAAVLIVSFLIHGTGYALSVSLCTRVEWVPCISPGSLLVALGSSRDDAVRLDGMLRTYRWWILGYQTIASFCGFVAGATYSSLAASGALRRLVRHRWIYDLSTDGYTYAYVLTHIRQDHRILMYKGFLETFGLQQDGRFSYIILRDVVRMYMELGESGPTTSDATSQRPIGQAAGGKIDDPAGKRPMRRVHSHLVIEGEDIANAVFDSLEIDAKPLPPADFEALVQTIQREMNETRDRLKARGIEVTEVATRMPEPKSTKGKRRR